jgi:hypothetical protein
MDFFTFVQTTDVSCCIWQVTSKKAAIINHYSEMKEKLGPEASISIGN